MQVRLVISTKVDWIRGIGNLLLTSAIDLSGFSFHKIEKFAKLLNLKFLGKSVYYDHRENYVFPKIDHAWRKTQSEQISEITESGRSLQLAVDGQWDSSGHNATL